MKAFCLFLLCGCLCSYGGWAQQLRGWFQTVPEDIGFERDIFQFEGNRFFYKNFNCGGTVQGNGTFICTNGALILHFAQSDSANVVTPLPGVASSVGAPVCYFQVVDKQTGQGLPGVTIASTTQPRWGISTNADGKGVLTYSSFREDTLLVTAVGYAPVRVVLPPRGSQGFLIKMGFAEYLPAGTVMTFPIRSIGARAFAIQRYPTDKGPYAHYRYRRISSKKAQQLMQAR